MVAEKVIREKGVPPSPSRLITFSGTIGQSQSDLQALATANEILPCFKDFRVFRFFIFLRFFFRFFFKFVLFLATNFFENHRGKENVLLDLNPR